jgi:hypothetical protein
VLAEKHGAGVAIRVDGDQVQEEGGKAFHGEAPVRFSAICEPQVGIAGGSSTLPHVRFSEAMDERD